MLRTVFFICFIAKLIEAYEPLNLQVPSIDEEYESPAETFTLCDLRLNIYKDYCLNSGICYTFLENTKSTTTKKLAEIKDEIFCSCSFEFTGPRCEIKLTTATNDSMLLSIYQMANEIINKNQNEINEKQSQPLAKQSESASIECPFKCMNGGKCIYDAFNIPRCLCPFNFTGLDCSLQRYCLDLSSCPLVCDFGYEKVNGCETCKCKCVNEKNYFDEIKNSFVNVKLGANESTFITNKSKFCLKTCPFGYVKDDHGCYKCLCIHENGLVNSRLRPTEKPDRVYVSNDTKSTEELIDGSSKAFNLTRQSCLNIRCKPNEVCKYFETNMYRCPHEIMNCEPYDQATIIPVCVSTLYNAPCLQNIKIGSCQTYSERYYFDIIDKECKKFYYAGCGGNRNNFMSMAECNELCLKPRMDTNSYEKYPSMNNMPEHLLTTKLSYSNQHKTISPLNENLKPFDYNIKKANNQTNVEESSACQWVCNLNCPFGYKLNERTKCYKCECIDLNMTECGVPCYLPGTKNCLFSMRANSRPKCVCNEDYDGVYCQMYHKHFNFTVKLDRFIYLNKEISYLIKNSLETALSNLLDIGKNSIRVDEIKSNDNKAVLIHFGIYAPDFSNSTYFYGLVDTVQRELNSRNLTISILSRQYTILQHCENTNEMFVMDLNENYFHKIEKLKQLIQDLKLELTKSYKFPPESINLVKVTIEPVVQIEFTIANKASDPEFCLKSYFLHSDIRTRAFTLSKYDAKFLQLSDNVEEKRSGSILWDDTSSDETMLHAARNSDDTNSINQVTSPNFMNHSVVFVSVIVASFLVLLFLVGLVVITQLKRKQCKEISKIGESCSHIGLSDNYDKHTRSNCEFPGGYFLPNYSANRNVVADSNQTVPLPVHKMNVMPY